MSTAVPSKSRDDKVVSQAVDAAETKNDELGKKEEPATCEDEMLVSRRSRITRHRSLSSSSLPKKTSRGDAELPHVFLIEFDFQGKVTKRQRKVFGNKHEAARDVQGTLHTP